MLDLLAAQAADTLAWLAPVVTGVLGWFGKSQHDRWKNGRRGNPGPNADDYRYGGKGGSNCKPGLGQVCREHGDGISDNRAAIAALGANMETYSEQVAVIFKQLHDIQEKVTTLVERVGD